MEHFALMKNWPLAEDYDRVDREIKTSVRKTASEVVYLGFLLRRMVDEKLYLARYDDFDSYLCEELHMDYTLANRFMGINKKYSIGGDSMSIDEKYVGYSQGLLIEMLSMAPELEEKVRPDMTVKQAREIKRQDKQKSVKMKPDVRGLMDDTYCAACGGELDEDERPEKCPRCGQMQDWSRYTVAGIIDGEYTELEGEKSVATSQLEKSPYGLEKTEYPEGSLLTTPGCGNKYDCFSCAQDCNIRQEDRYCVLAPLGNPFPCTTIAVLDNLKEEVGDKCQFVNNDIASNKAGNGEADPCCRDCKELCGYRCQRAKLQEELEGDEYEMRLLRDMLDEAKGVLKNYIDFGDIPGRTVHKQKLLVGALANMVCELEDMQEKEETAAEMQQELPILKNNDQRKQWLNNYKVWGLWYRDESIDVNYYKFDFSEGSRLVVAEYPQRYHYYGGARKDEYFYHLLEKNKKGYKEVYDEEYRQQADSETYLIEFLKAIQKKGD